MSLDKRSFGVVFVESILSNYNGDPDADNLPRTLIDGHGLITPVCFKHKIRELLEYHDSPVWEYLKLELDLDDDAYYIWESALKGYDAETPMEAKEKFWYKKFKKEGGEYLVNRFWDMRTFGTTALETKGKDSLKFTRTGCVSISPFISLAPVEIISQTITKGNPLRPELMKKDQGDIAPFGFKVARHAVFTGSYVVNPAYARATNTTEKDIDVFKALIPYAVSNSTSACRSGMNVVQAVHVAHDNPLGSFNESEFYEFCKPIVDKSVKQNGSTSLNQYTFKTQAEIENRFPDLNIEMIVSIQSEVTV